MSKAALSNVSLSPHNSDIKANLFVYFWVLPTAQIHCKTPLLSFMWVVEVCAVPVTRAVLTSRFKTLCPVSVHLNISRYPAFFFLSLSFLFSLIICTKGQVEAVTAHALHFQDDGVGHSNVTLFPLECYVIYRLGLIERVINGMEKWVHWMLINIDNALSRCNGLFPSAVHPQTVLRYPAVFEMRWMEARGAEVCGNRSSCHLPLLRRTRWQKR